MERVIVKTLVEKPVNATHWSTRSMAAEVGMSQTAISKIWRGLQSVAVVNAELAAPIGSGRARRVLGLIVRRHQQAIPA